MRMKKPPVLMLMASLLLTAFIGIAEEALPSPSPAPETRSAVLSLGGDLFLINREHRISRTYEPEDLVRPDVQTRKKSLQDRILMRGTAAGALERMFAAALIEKGYTLYATSGYRSYGIQQILFSDKVAEAGTREKAQRRVAPAGTSEHQLGLAMDLQSPSELNLNAAFGGTPEGKWVMENAHRFGFILRYKGEWSDVTGYSEEPWHVRYVGIAHASAIHELNIPLETYVELASEWPDYVLTGASHVLLAGLMRDMMQGNAAETLAVLSEAEEEEREEALRNATAPYLKDGMSYEQALWYAYPTPKPTSGPRIDHDEETHLAPGKGG